MLFIKNRFNFFSISLVLLGLSVNPILADEQGDNAYDKSWTEVSGTGIHYFSTSINHKTVPTPTGKIDYNTDTIDLSGDLNGRVIYHVTSEMDFAAGTMINTGHQVFSGTILDSDPVLLLDDDFIFMVNLNTGETIGEVFLTQRLAGETTQCQLSIVGTGFDENGNGLAEYTGRCRRIGGLICAVPYEQ